MRILYDITFIGNVVFIFLHQYIGGKSITTGKEEQLRKSAVYRGFVL